MSYFDIASGLPGASEKTRVIENPRESHYRYYKCSKNTCNKVIHADKHTINIPNYFPESLDVYVIRYQLKTFLPITIS